MKSLSRWLLPVLLLLSWPTPGWVGTWTASEFVYKPSEGARGGVEKNLFDAGMDRIDARLRKEIWVGDPKNGATLSEAVTAIGNNKAILRVPAGNWSITSNLAIPANITLKSERDAIFSIANGVTLSINGGLEAGAYPIFSCAGTGKVALGNYARDVWVEWWGAAGDGVIDNTAAITAAINALANITGSIKFNKGTYLCGNLNIVTKTNSLQFVGRGTDDTVLLHNGTGSFFAFTETYRGAGLQNLTLKAGANTTNLLYLLSASRMNIANVRFNGNSVAGVRGIKLDGASTGGGVFFNLFSNLDIANCAVGIDEDGGTGYKVAMNSFINCSVGCATKGTSVGLKMNYSQSENFVGCDFETLHVAIDAATADDINFIGCWVQGVDTQIQYTNDSNKINIFGGQWGLGDYNYNKQMNWMANIRIQLKAAADGFTGAFSNATNLPIQVGGGLQIYRYSPDTPWSILAYGPTASGLALSKAGTPFLGFVRASALSNWPSIYTGDGAPGSLAANNGSVYIDGTNGTIYKKDSSDWYQLYAVRGTPSAGKVIKWNAGGYAEWATP